MYVPWCIYRMRWSSLLNPLSSLKGCVKKAVSDSWPHVIFFLCSKKNLRLNSYGISEIISGFSFPGSPTGKFNFRKDLCIKYFFLLKHTLSDSRWLTSSTPITDIISFSHPYFSLCSDSKINYWPSGVKNVRQTYCNSSCLETTFWFANHWNITLFKSS